MPLDQENENIGYVLGRLFCVLERIAHPGFGKKFPPTFYETASRNPRVWFLMRLAELKDKIAKRELDGYEPILASILGLLDGPDIPERLSLDDQGRWDLGYYHQLAAIDNAG